MTISRPLTIIESPFSDRNGRTEAQNLLYLRDCLRDSWLRGELPFASHGFFPLFLHESDPEERKLGIEAGFAFWDFVTSQRVEIDPGRFAGLRASGWPLITFYCDWGMSNGMKDAYDRAIALNREIEIRHILSVGEATPSPQLNKEALK